jgi:hypothetical protein
LSTSFSGRFLSSGDAPAHKSFSIIDFFHRAVDATSSNNAKSRWFALHSTGNWVIAATCVWDVVGTVAAPLCAMVSPMQSWIPSHLAFGLHMYHMLAYTDLRAADVFHHVVFVGTFGAVNFLMSW